LKEKGSKRGPKHLIIIYSAGNVLLPKKEKEAMAGSESFVYEASQPGCLHCGVSWNIVPGAFAQGVDAVSMGTGALKSLGVNAGVVKPRERGTRKGLYL
jgi:hypothetical protein